MAKKKTEVVSDATVTEEELDQVARANTSGKQPVVFVHGLWLLASSWDAWRTLFEERGFATVAADWPDDPDTVAAGRALPDAFAGKSVGAITDHVADLVRALDRSPVLVGHSFGGLIVQKLAGLGLAAATVAIDPAPFRGVLPLPMSALKAAFPVLRNPANRKKAVMLTADQFRFAFTNAVSAEEADELYAAYPVPGSGVPLFQAATANLNPATDASVDSRAAGRGPLLVVSGEKDHTVPWAIAHASFKKQKRNAAVTEVVEIPGAGHSLVIDSGWPDVADKALSFLDRQGIRAAG
jgi:pimeloyl-ACP methyl ester carboxylesterase